MSSNAECARPGVLLNTLAGSKWSTSVNTSCSVDVKVCFPDGFFTLEISSKLCKTASEGTVLQPRRLVVFSVITPR